LAGKDVSCFAVPARGDDSKFGPIEFCGEKIIGGKAAEKESSRTEIP
jgi:hypothetical protein